MTANQTHELVLEGCTPVPLAGYLKALGVLRLLGEQKPEWAVRGAWRADRFVLRSPVFSGDAQENIGKILSFFLDAYRPTPVIAPWNGGSGFYPNDNRAGIDRIADGRSVRFADYRTVIEFGRGLVKRFGFDESPKNEKKSEFLGAARSLAPESFLPWMDAAVLLAGDEPRYPPLLGTGGNDGRLDFTNNFMQRITELLALATGEATDAARAWLPSALFCAVVPGMASAAIGQFHPGGAGGPNASAGFEADPLMNPWDFALMLEGALFFAAAVTRRLEAAEPGMLAYPFTVRPSGVGSGAVGAGDEGQARAEIWLPLWIGFASAPEIRMLLAEGRATLGRRPVRDGFGFVRAVAALGVDRGISAFQRYGFLMRSGKAYLATPLTRVSVRRNPDANLIEDLESRQFLDRLRRFGRDDQTPASIRSQVRQLEDALFELAQRPEPRTLQKVLSSLGLLSVLLGRSRKGREAVPPVPVLSENWVMKADDGSAEFRIAVALAGLGSGLPMRPFVVPVKEEKYGWSWYPESRMAVWSEGNFASNMGNVIARRRLDGERSGDDGSPFQYATGVMGADVAMCLAGLVDDARLTGLFLGLVNARIPKHLGSHGETAVLPAAYSVLKPFFTPTGLLVHFDMLPPERLMSLPGELVIRLRAGRVQDAVDWAWWRLRAIGYPLPSYPRTSPSTRELDGPRLLTALAIPLEFVELGRCLGAVTQQPSVETV